MRSVGALPLPVHQVVVEIEEFCLNPALDLLQQMQEAITMYASERKPNAGKRQARIFEGESRMV